MPVMAAVTASEMLIHGLLGFVAFLSFICIHQATKALPPGLRRFLTSSLHRPSRDVKQQANLSTQDDIEYQPPRPAERDVLGGAGSYSALGARLFSPAPDLSKTIGWVVDQGSDFPPAVADLIDSWDTSALTRHDDTRLTTRGWNGYVDDNETRAFKYTTPKKRLTADDLVGTPLLHATAIHMVCSPSRCRELVTDLVALRKASPPDPDDPRYADYSSRPLVVWEPVPDLCTPDELLNLTNCLPLVDVCSPNHAELAGFMGDADGGLDPETGEISAAAVERSCEQLLGSMPLSSFALVVRAGEKGCYVAKNGGRRKASKAKTKGGDGEEQADKGATRRRRKEIGHHGGLTADTDMMSLFAGLLQQMPPDDETTRGYGDGDGDGADADADADGGGKEATYSFIRSEDNEVEMDPGLDRWIPAFWTGGDAPARVVDPTGGGNTFLGGLAVALARGRCVEEAAGWGSVAASFAIEQVGVPALGRDGEDRETWNGDRVGERLRTFQERIGWSAE